MYISRTPEHKEQLSLIANDPIIKPLIDNIVNDISNKGIVIANTLNIREKPTKDSTDIGDLHKGDIVDILNYVDGWYYISIDSRVGWASKQYIIV